MMNLKQYLNHVNNNSIINYVKKIFDVLALNLYPI